MALVAYDNSDSSDYGDDENASVPVVILNKKVEEEKAQHVSEVLENSEQTESTRLFKLLPQPSVKKSVILEEDDEFLRKKEVPSSTVKSKAKITVPSLSDFKDVEDRPIAKPRVASNKKSGLLSILPQPKHAASATKTTSLVPHVLTKKPLVPTTVKKKEPLPSPIKRKDEKKGLISGYSDDSDDDDEDTTDFFSINKPVEVPTEDIQLDIDKLTDSTRMNINLEDQRASRIQSFFKPDVELQPDAEEDIQGYEASIQDIYDTNTDSRYTNGYLAAAPENSGEAVLDDEAIRQLVGSRGKRKREEIQIVDVNQQDVLADARELLLKGLMDDTSKRVSSSKKRGNEPTTQQRKKHQITYLAHQAKANEAELQNQWANNKMSRRQTQSKYGF